MGGNTTQPMGAGASNPMGGAQAPMGQGAPQGQQEAEQFAQQRYDQAGGQGAPQDMSRFAGNGMMGMMGQGAPQPLPLDQQTGTYAGNGMMGMMGQQGYPGMDSKAISADPAGFAQNVQGAQRQEAQYPGSTFLSQGQGGQGAPQDMSQFAGNGGAGKGSVNPGAPGNYPPPPGYGPGQGAMPGMMGQGAPQNMSQFAGNGMGMMGQSSDQFMKNLTSNVGPQALYQAQDRNFQFPQLGSLQGSPMGQSSSNFFGANNPQEESYGNRDENKRGGSVNSKHDDSIRYALNLLRQKLSGR
tara:strand:- start:229 stop:1122 length:894 start_codon:yes stop_codon:yes gene_type:complete